MAARISRRTGAQVEVCEAEPNGYDSDGGKWALVCWSHFNVANCETKKVALSWVSQSDYWCEGCAEVFDKKIGGETGWILV
jgi:hypothetical protein